MMHLVLPSSSSRSHYPDNRAGHYFTKLPKMIDLEGDDWEVALSEVYFANSFQNQTSDECFAEISVTHAKHLFSITKEFSGTLQFKVYLPKGQYSSPTDIASALNDLIYAQPLGAVLEDMIQFQYDRFSRKMSLIMRRAFILVRLSPPMQILLSMDHNDYRGVGIFTGRRRFQIYGEVKRVYIYCNIVGERVVGDSSVPLLRSIPILDRNADMVYRLYRKPFYIPLKIRQFDTIELLLADEQGAEVQFLDDNTEITLSLRRRRE